MKILLIAVIGFVALLLAVMASGISNSVDDFRTDEFTETFDGDTDAGETTTNIQLGSALWNSNIAEASATTNSTTDAPSLSSYNTTSRQITVSGLSENTSRTITVVYRSAGLSEYGGAEDLSQNIPTIILIFIIVIPSIGLISLIVWAVKGRR